MTEYVVYGDAWFSMKIEAPDEDRARLEALSMLIRDDEVRLAVRNILAETTEAMDE